MIGSPIHLMASLLINWIAICMYSKMEYCSKSHWEIYFKLCGRILLDLHHLTFTSMIIVMLKSWFLWWQFGSDFYSSWKGILWQNMSDQHVYIKWCIWCILWIVNLHCKIYFLSNKSFSSSSTSIFKHNVISMDCPSFLDDVVKICIFLVSFRY